MRRLARRGRGGLGTSLTGDLRRLLGGGALPLALRGRLRRAADGRLRRLLPGGRLSLLPGIRLRRTLPRRTSVFGKLLLRPLRRRLLPLAPPRGLPRCRLLPRRARRAGLGVQPFRMRAGIVR